MQWKEPAIRHMIRGQTNEWEKERNKKNDEILRAVYINK